MSPCTIYLCAEVIQDKSVCDSYVWIYLRVFPADTVDSITPDKVRGLRDMLNSSAMDIMYYTSPLYRDEVSLTLICTTLH